jgi:hypothetical protein
MIIMIKIIIWYDYTYMQWKKISSAFLVIFCFTYIHPIKILILQ